MVPPSWCIVVIATMSMLLGWCNSRVPFVHKKYNDIEVSGQKYFLQMMKKMGMINGFNNVKNRRTNASTNIELNCANEVTSSLLIIE